MFSRWKLAHSVADAIVGTMASPTDEDLELVAVEVVCFMPELERCIPTFRQKIVGAPVGWETLYNHLKREAEIKDTLARA